MKNRHGQVWMGPSSESSVYLVVKKAETNDDSWTTLNLETGQTVDLFFRDIEEDTHWKSLP